MFRGKPRRSANEFYPSLAMPVATPTRSPSSGRGLSHHFLRSLSALLVTSRLIGQSLAALRPEFSSSPDVDRKITALINTGKQGEDDLGKPLREAGIVLPSTPNRTVAAPIVTTLYRGVPGTSTAASPATETVLNLRLLAQHLELRARLAAEYAKIAGEEPLRRVLSNWARQWWTAARA